MPQFFTAKITIPFPGDVVYMKRAMLTAGARRVLLMDGSKIGRTSLHHYVPVSVITDVVITDDVPADVIAELEELEEQATIHIAPLQ